MSLLNTSTSSLLSLKKLTCYELLCRGDMTNTPCTPTDDKEAEKYHTIIANVLAQLVARGDKLKCVNKQFRSSSGRLPPITLDAYIARLLQYAPCEKECFLAALLFMDRLSDMSGFIYNSMNIHRSYLVSLLLAAKFFEDQPCDNGYFATVGGVSLQELNVMEVQFLSMVDYRVSVNGHDYNVYAEVVEENVNNIGKPKIFFQEPSLTPVTPDTSIMFSRYVSPPAVAVATST